MKKYKKFISFLTASAIALTANVSAAAETVSAPQLTDIHGYACYERDGEYWTVIDGQEYLVIDLDSFIENESQTPFNEDSCSPYSTQATTSPIGKPDGHIRQDWVNLTEAGGSYEDRCYLTYGNYYSPVYYFVNEGNNRSEVTANISTKVVFNNTYYIDVWVHTVDYTGAWHKVGIKKRFDFNAFNPIRALFTGTPNQIIDGLALVFLDDSPGQKELYYTVEVAVNNS